jgi:hypothetical protein
MLEVRRALFARIKDFRKIKRHREEQLELPW